MTKKLNQKGQVIIVLLLTMLGALVIGLAITQRSITDVATSTQSEQASRAFSAAEAGIEKLLNQQATIGNISESEFGNQSGIQNAKLITALPRPSQNGQPGQALEYPPIGKESIAQFWLVDPDNPNPCGLASCPPGSGFPYNDANYKAYRGNRVDVYFGNSDLREAAKQNSLETPAIEVNLITKDFSVTDSCASPPCSAFKAHRYFFDPISNATVGRYPNNGFRLVADNASSCDSSRGTCLNPALINTSNSPDTNATTLDRAFRARVTIPPAGDPPLGSQERMILLRVRILYSNNSQAVAVKPYGTCGADCSLPSQARIYTSTGVSGRSQKTIQIFRLTNVASPLFDFALFSAGSINK